MKQMKRKSDQESDQECGDLISRYERALVNAHSEHTQDKILLENEIARLKRQVLILASKQGSATVAGDQRSRTLGQRQIRAAAIRQDRVTRRISLCSLKVHAA